MMSRFGLAAPLLAMVGAGGAGAGGVERRHDGRTRRAGDGPGRRLMSSGALCADRVVNTRGEVLGTVSELMLDVERGCIAYVVMAYGGFMGLGEKLYALPWSALKLDTERGYLLLDADRSVFETAPAFDKEHWPSMPDAQWHREVHRHYRSRPYWSD